jgi:predicted kinase
MEEEEYFPMYELRFRETNDLAWDIKIMVSDEDCGVIVILRGLPGSGKTAFANELAYCITRHSLRCEICSADEFFYDEKGVYMFDSSQLNAVHEQCQDRFAAAMKRGVDCIIIDNTNLYMWEFADYEWEGHQSGYHMKYVEFECENFQHARMLLNRTTRDIDIEILERKFNAFKNQHLREAIMVPTEDSIRF